MVPMVGTFASDLPSATALHSLDVLVHVMTTVLQSLPHAHMSYAVTGAGFHTFPSTCISPCCAFS